MARAALVQGWNRARSKRGLSALASLQPSGTAYTGDANGGNIGVAVEVYLGAYGWVDVTDFTQYRDGSAKLNISRGRPDEAGTYQPQTASIMLNNRDFRFSPRNPTGPYYGLIGRNTPVRISRMHDGTRWYRYAGEIPEWPSSADVSGNDIYSQINAYGQLRRLNQGISPLGSALKRNLISPFRKYSQSIFSYWPCEDSSSATQFASAFAGAAPLVIAGSGVTPASDSACSSSDPIPVLTTGKLVGSVPGYTGTGAVSLRFVTTVPSGGMTGTNHVLSLLCSGGNLSKVSVMVDASGDCWFLAYDFSGTEVSGNTPVAFGMNGKTLTVGVDVSQSGSDVSARIYMFDMVQPTLNPFTSSVPLTPFTFTVSSHTFGTVTGVTVNDDAGMNGSSIGHIVLANSSAAYTSTSGAMFANQGESVSGRISRLFTEQNVNSVSKQNSEDPFAISMGIQKSDTLANLVQQAVDTGNSLVYEARDQVAVAERTRCSLYGQGTQYNTVGKVLVLDYAQNQLSAQPIPKDDDFHTANSWTASRTGGSSATMVLSSGPMSTSPPPDGVGEYDTAKSFSLFSDSLVADKAGWQLHLGTVNQPRFPAVSVDLRNQNFQNSPLLTSQVLSIDIGDVIELDNLPGWISADPVRLIVQGYQESMGAFEHDITFNCSPEDPYRVAMLDDPVLSRCDTDGSTLAAPLSTLLNTDGVFATGTSSWVTNSCTLTQVGTSGSANPLPVGGPPGYGALLTPNGGSSSGAVQKHATFAVTGNQAYNVSALVYYPSAAHTVQLGLDWRLADGTSISTSSAFTAVSAGVWTAISVSFTAPANAVLADPVVGLGGTPTAGDALYVTGVAVWQGAVTVAATDPTKPLWTTASGDFPFDVAVGGERMTVTGISGSSSPQAFTVARAVNGVLKPQNTGSDVRLWQPMILSL